jgi:hypothetical protein
MLIDHRSLVVIVKNLGDNSRIISIRITSEDLKVYQRSTIQYR